MDKTTPSFPTNCCVPPARSDKSPKKGSFEDIPSEEPLPPTSSEPEVFVGGCRGSSVKASGGIHQPDVATPLKPLQPVPHPKAQSPERDRFLGSSLRSGAENARTPIATALLAAGDENLRLWAELGELQEAMKSQKQLQLHVAERSAVDKVDNGTTGASLDENRRLREELAELRKLASMQESTQHELLRRKAPKVAKAMGHFANGMRKAPEERVTDPKTQQAVEAGLREFDAVLLEQKLHMCDLMRSMLEDASFEVNPDGAPS